MSSYPLLPLLNSPPSSPSSTSSHRPAKASRYHQRLSSLTSLVHPHLPSRRQVRALLFATCLLVVTILAYLFLSRSMHPFAIEDRQGRCEFVSPLEAYYRRASTSQAAGGERPNAAGLSWKENGELGYDVSGLDGQGAEEHPVLRLLEQGEIQWQNVLKGEPRSLSEAVSSYERKWGRRPPKGFDSWFAFTQKHNVLLPSTYHPRLQSSLEPYRALPPKEYVRRAQMVEDFNTTFVLDVAGGPKGRVKVDMKAEIEARWPGSMQRAKEQAELMKPFVKDLPPMRVTFSIDDSPSIFPHHKRTTELCKLAEQGLYDERASEEVDSPVVDWDAVCGKTLDSASSAGNAGSFIYDHEKSMDVCHNPSLLSQQGIFLETRAPDTHRREHSMHLPLLSFSKTPANGGILAAPLDQFEFKRGRDPPWAKKTKDKLVWRGATTGIVFSPVFPWRSSHRARLNLLANPPNSTRSIATARPTLPLEVIAPASGESAGRVRLKTVSPDHGNLSRWQDWAFDIAFTGRAIQCEGLEGNNKGIGATGTCKEMRDEFRFAKHQQSDELNKHKFLLDVDGNAWSGRFRRLLSTNSLIFKSTIYPEWYSHSLIPWFHYVPVSSSYADLLPLLAFFRGAPPSHSTTSASHNTPSEGFDEVAEAIARNGQCFVRRMWRKEDLQAYMYLVYLEMGRLLKGGRGGEMDLPPLPLE